MAYDGDYLAALDEFLGGVQDDTQLAASPASPANSPLFRLSALKIADYVTTKLGSLAVQDADSVNITGGSIAFTPTGGITANTVDGAIAELDSDITTLSETFTTGLSGKQDADADLSALAGLSGNGIAVRTADNTWAQRSLAGTANQISVASGDGVSGDPTISLPSSVILPGTVGYPDWVNVASSASPDIGAAASNFVRITGTTTITGFTASAASTWRFVRFASCLTLVYSRTSLILPGKANIVTAAGDVMLIKSGGSGAWRVLGYWRASGAPNTPWKANIPRRNYVTAQPWLISTSAADNNWWSMCWSPELGLFCAVSTNGTGNRVMTSPDGVNWTIRSSAVNNSWFYVCWSSELGLFCAVANTGTGNRVMTSPDGVNWTARTSPADNNWRSVCWSPELGLFCAVAYSGTGNRVMTSPDGVNWTIRTSAADNNWSSVCWSPELGLFCAVAYSGAGNRVMTSPDGVNWTLGSSAADNSWLGICWSPELRLFCAVSDSGSGNRVMTSPDGVNWTIRTSAADNSWFSVCWSADLGLFCAVAYSGTSNRVMTSPDGVNWTIRTSAADNTWRSVCWSPELGMFCAVGDSGTGNRCMTSVQASGAQNGQRRIGAPGTTVINTDAAATITPLIDATNVRHTGTLTADRTLNLSTSNVTDGTMFRITRTGSGAFNLSVGGLKNLATNQWCEVTYVAAIGAWVLTQFGSL